MRHFLLKKKILTTLLVVLILITGCSSPQKATSVRQTKFFMGTVVEVVLYGEKKDLNKERTDKVFSQLFKEIELIEEKFTAGKINGGAPVFLDQESFYLLRKSLYFSELSEGSFDITVGPLTNLWNIRTGEKNQIPDKNEIEKSISLVDYKRIKFTAPGTVQLDEKDMFADFGAIAKGYAADRCAEILEENGVKTAVLNLGGNIYAQGDRIWKFGIQDPFMTRGDYLGIVSLKNQSLVTSGIYEKYFEEDGRIYHHIFDTKTGYPVNNELLSLSVISEKSLDGDALSTAAFVLGLEKGAKLLEEYEGAEGVFITKDNEIYLTSGLSSENFQLVKNDKYQIKKGR